MSLANCESLLSPSRLKRALEHIFPPPRRSVGRPRGFSCVVECPTCLKQFPVPSYRYKRRILNSKSGNLYCSRFCQPLGARAGAASQLKQRGMSDEQFYWEKLLTREGLGIGTGASHLDYGETDDPRDRVLRKRKNRGY